MFNFNNNQNNQNDLMKDLSKLLKEEGDFVQELSDVSTKAAGFHARLESIEKALETNPSAYSTQESNGMVEKATQKYSQELEKSMKQETTGKINVMNNMNQTSSMNQMNSTNQNNMK